MSLLSRNELEIALYPDRIAWDRVRRALTLHGYRQDADGRGIICCELAEEGEAPWHGAVKTLESALPALVEGKTEVTVVLSNHFVQYTLVPWLDKLNDEEEAAFAQHCFRDMYGGVADSWSLRLSPGRAGASALASAVDSTLLDELHALAQRLGLNLKSIQPNLMAVYNSCRPSLERRSAWLALLEPGSVCLVLQQKGLFAWVRKMRISDAWHEELPTILERETYLAEAEGATNDVLVWAPHLDEADLPSLGRWDVQALKPGRNLDHRLKYRGLHTLVVA